ncbi:MAG: hypothetical protein ACLFT5_06010 [Desulfovermiculus sp.]
MSDARRRTSAPLLAGEVSLIKDETDGQVSCRGYALFHARMQAGLF